MNAHATSSAELFNRKFLFFKNKKKRMYQLTNERTNKKKIRTKNNIFFIYLYINKTEEVKEETQTPFSDY